MKDEKCPHTRKTLHWQRQGLGGGEPSEPWRRAQQQGFQGEKQRDSRTEDGCRPELTGLRVLSAHPLGRVGAGT